MASSQYDVIVAGGGPAGIASAVAAARDGAKTLLIERSSCLGGTLAMGIPLLAVFDGQGNRAVAGIMEEMVQRLIQEGGSVGHVLGARWSNNGYMQGDQFSLAPIDPELVIYVAQEMVLEAGADILLHSWITGVTMEGSAVTGVKVYNKSGEQTYTAQVVIDTTGDADLCMHAGAQMLSKQRVQNSTILFTMSNVDTEKLAQALQEGTHVDGKGWWHSRLVTSKKVNSDRETHAHIAGHFVFEDQTVTFTAVSVREGEVSLNATRTVNVDAADALSLTKGEISERRNIRNLTLKLKKHVPGFEEAYVSRSNPIGIRESRTIIGDYLLTDEDIIEGRDFEDSIARGAYPSDIHDPRGGKTQFVFIRNGGTYGIPYRCLLPKGIDNLIAAGRSISATQTAMGTIRLQSTVMAQGQAAGTAAAMAVKQQVTPRTIDTASLRASLVEQKAII